MPIVTMVTYLLTYFLNNTQAEGDISLYLLHHITAYTSYTILKILQDENNEGIYVVWKHCKGSSTRPHN